MYMYMNELPVLFTQHFKHVRGYHSDEWGCLLEQVFVDDVLGEVHTVLRLALFGTRLDVDRDVLRLLGPGDSGVVLPMDEGWHWEVDAHLFQRLTLRLVHGNAVGQTHGELPTGELDCCARPIVLDEDSGDEHDVSCQVSQQNHAGEGMGVDPQHTQASAVTESGLHVQVHDGHDDGSGPEKQPVTDVRKC